MQAGLCAADIGSRFRRKGVDRAVIALASLAPEVRGHSRLIVVGGDNPKRFLRLVKARAVADRVSFEGARQAVAAYYYVADLLIHPAYTGNPGTTLIEAMIYGLSVLVTENCGFAFHVRDARAGLVCPLPFRQEELNQMLTAMLTTDERADWSKNGRAYCERTDLYSLIDKAADIIIARAARNSSR